MTAKDYTPIGTCDIQALDCCGIKELSGITMMSPREVLASIVEYSGTVYDWCDAGHKFNRYSVLENCPPFFVFSDHRRGHRKGEALKKYILDNGLGKVWASETRRNPSGSRYLRMYVYEPDKKALVDWHEKAVYPKGHKKGKKK